MFAAIIKQTGTHPFVTTQQITHPFVTIQQITGANIKICSNRHWNENKKIPDNALNEHGALIRAGYTNSTSQDHTGTSAFGIRLSSFVSSIPPQKTCRFSSCCGINVEWHSLIFISFLKAKDYLPLLETSLSTM